VGRAGTARRGGAQLAANRDEARATSRGRRGWGRCSPTRPGPPPGAGSGSGRHSG